jgi:Phosphotransferase enzyme family
MTKKDMLARMGQIAGHAIDDRLRKPVATTSAEVPRGPEGLTADWLTAVICRDAPGAQVESFNVGDISAGSTSRGRIELTYNAAGHASGLPPSMWFKSAPNFVTRVTVGLTNAAENEGRFYMQVRPGLEMMAPVGYYGAADPVSCRSIVMLEDLARTRNAFFGGPEERYVTRGMAESMARELATYHGAMWNSPRLKGDLSWLPTCLEWQENTNSVMAFQKRSLIGVDRAADVSAPGFVDRRNELWPAFMRSLTLNLSGPQTFLHQDVHAGNWFSTPEGEMGLYDWHCIARGGWGLDFAYAFMSGLTIEDRRAWERELIEYYLERLKAAGVESPPSFERAFLQYRQQVFHGLFFWLITIGAGKLQPDMQPVEISRANLARMTQAVMDLDSLEALNELL